jgi:hypothetical protein
MQTLIVLNLTSFHKPLSERDWDLPLPHVLALSLVFGRSALTSKLERHHSDNILADIVTLLLWHVMWNACAIDDDMTNQS